MKTPLRRLVACTTVAAVTVLGLAGCGRDDDGGDGETAAVGVTSEPCADSPNEDNGCIYLGVISDFTGVFQPIGEPMTQGAQAFWKSVNEAGGIGGYDVDIVTHVKDNGYNETTHAQVYQEIEGEILMLAHSIGTAHTNAILDDARDNDIVVLPVSLGSNWLFEEGVMHVGTSYCAEGMNIVDYAVDELDAESIGLVHFPGDYGDDSANGARIAAEARGIEVFDYTTGQGGADDQTAVISGIMKDEPDVVLVATTALEVGAIVGTTVAQGYGGKFIGAMPSWAGALLDSPAAPAIQASYIHAASIPAWDADTPGHEAMREAAGDTTPNDWFAVGWAGSHALKALLEKAIDNDDLTRAGVVEALNELDGIDSQGMLPEGDGHYAGEPNENAARSTFFNGPDKDSATGISQVVESFVGPTVEDYEFTQACYLM